MSKITTEYRRVSDLMQMDGGADLPAWITDREVVPVLVVVPEPGPDRFVEAIRRLPPTAKDAAARRVLFSDLQTVVYNPYLCADIANRGYDPHEVLRGTSEGDRKFKHPADLIAEFVARQAAK